MVSDECINNLKSETRLRIAAGYYQQIASKYPIGVIEYRNIAAGCLERVSFHYNEICVKYH